METILDKKNRLKAATEGKDGYVGIKVHDEKLILLTKTGKDAKCTNDIPEDLKELTQVKKATIKLLSKS